MQPNVLILSPQVHTAPHSGVGMRGYFQSVHLSERWPITLASESGIYDVQHGVFRRLGQDMRPSTPMRHNMTAYIRSILSGNHYLYEKYHCDRWSVPPLENYSHVIIHYSAMLTFAQNSPTLSNTQIILDTHNNEREYFHTVAQQSSNPLKRAVISTQASVAERIIKNASSLLAATISVSESDRNWVADLCDEDTRHFVIPNNLFRYQPVSWTGARTILFVGSLDVTMNLQALDWFTTKVWPKLKGVEPSVKFVVVGRNPSPTLMAHLASQGIEVIANAPSLTELYAEATCAVVPASSGSGAKIKVCEALAHGVPVITTEHGLVGQPAAIRACCTVVEDPDAWAGAIKERIARGRCDATWDAEVERALDRSYFGSSIRQIIEFIEDTAIQSRL